MKKYLIPLLMVSHFVQAAPMTNEEASLIESSRATFAHELHLMASDLIDDLVYQWTQSPPFDSKTKVVLLAVNIPMGLNARLEAFLENHFFNLITLHPESNLIPVYCAACTSLTTLAQNGQTVLGRGIDVLPDLAKDLGKSEKNAVGLYLDFDIETSDLVLRSRLVSLDSDRRIVGAYTASTSSSNPPLLREMNPLVSTGEAREAYLNVLKNRSPVAIPIRFSIDFFQPASEDETSISLPPMLWTQLGLETWVSRRREWLGGIMLGVSSFPRTYDAKSVSARLSRLLSDTYSLVSPNYYWYLETGYFEVEGPAATIFEAHDRLTPRDILDQANGTEHRPKAAEGKIKIGLELRFRQLYSAEVFGEQLPNQSKNENLGKTFGVFHAWGMGMGVTL